MNANNEILDKYPQLHSKVEQTLATGCAYVAMMQSFIFKLIFSLLYIHKKPRCARDCLLEIFTRVSFKRLYPLKF